MELESVLLNILTEPQFIGRDKEIELLTEKLETIEKTQQGEVLLISGFAGTGKTRLIIEFGKMVEEHGWIFYTGENEFPKNVEPYLPFKTILRAYYGKTFEPQENNAKSKWKKFKKLLKIWGKVVVRYIHVIGIFIGPDST